MGRSLADEDPTPGSDRGRLALTQPSVLHVITDSFSADCFVAPLARYLESEEWRNVIACSGQSYSDAHSFVAQMRAEGLDVREIDIARSIKPVADLCRLLEVWTLIRVEKPSLVHTHLGKGGIIGRIAAWLAGVPCVHTVYDYAFIEHRGLRRWFYRALECICAGLTRRIMFISENERRLGVSETVGDSSRFVTVGCGVDLSMFNPGNVSGGQLAEVKRRFSVPQGRIVVGTVARLIHRKGIDLLLQAATMLPTCGVDWHLFIVGGGPLQRYLVELAERLGLAGRVSFSGFVDDPPLMPALVGAMDIFCLPSRREGYGMVYAEAGAMEKAAVAPDVPPMNEIVVDGITGLLTKPEDPVSIASALRTLLLDQRLRRSMGQAAAAFVAANCDNRSASERTAAVYRDVLSQSWSDLIERAAGKQTTATEPRWSDSKSRDLG